MSCLSVANFRISWWKRLTNCHCCCWFFFRTFFASRLLKSFCKSFCKSLTKFVRPSVQAISRFNHRRRFLAMRKNRMKKRNGWEKERNNLAGWPDCFSDATPHLRHKNWLSTLFSNQLGCKMLTCSHVWNINMRDSRFTFFNDRPTDRPLARSFVFLVFLTLKISWRLDWTSFVMRNLH